MNCGFGVSSGYENTLKSYPYPIVQSGAFPEEIL